MTGSHRSNRLTVYLSVMVFFYLITGWVTGSHRSNRLTVYLSVVVFFYLITGGVTGSHRSNRLTVYLSVVVFFYLITGLTFISRAKRQMARETCVICRRSGIKTKKT